MKHKPIINKRIGAQFKQRVTIFKDDLSDSLSWSSILDDNQHKQKQIKNEPENKYPIQVKNDEERQKIFREFMNICEDTPEYESNDTLESDE